MKFIASADDLKRALALPSSTAMKTTPIPILTHVLLTANKSGLTITGANMDAWGESRCAADVEKAGAVAAHAGLLRSFVMAAEAGAQMSARHDKGVLVLGCGRASARVPALDADQFPPAPKPADATEFTLPSGDVLSAIKAVSAFAARDTRADWARCGVCLYSEDDKLLFVATEGKNLGIRRVPLPGVTVTPVIIPNEAVAAIASMLGDEGEAKITAGANAVSVEAGGSKITTRLIDAVFPDYRNATPETFAREATFAPAELSKAIARVAAFDHLGTRGIVRFSLTRGSLTVTAIGPSGQKAEDLIDVAYAGEPHDFSLPIAAINAILGAAHDGDAALRIPEVGPMMFVAGDSSDGFWLASAYYSKRESQAA